MKNKILYILLILTIAITSCKNSETDLALSEINHIKQLINEGQDSAALLRIDSIHTKFPKNIPIRRIADTLSWDIEYRHAIINLPNIDSSLTKLQERLPELQKNFIFIKNEEYQTLGSFEHKKLRTENNTSRCYLKPSVNEFGKLTITSYYIGPKANHNLMRITADSLFVESLIAPNSNISQFLDMGNYHEIIVFDENTLNNTIEFITKYKDSRIKISLIGEGQPYHYYLTPTEREAFAQSYELAITISNIIHLTDLQLRLSQKIELLRIRLNK